MAYCMNLDRIIIMLVSGTLCVYKLIECENSVLEKVVESTSIKDRHR